MRRGTLAWARVCPPEIPRLQQQTDHLLTWAGPAPAAFARIDDVGATTNSSVYTLA